jgi:hypothetical protein
MGHLRARRCRRAQSSWTFFSKPIPAGPEYPDALVLARSRQSAVWGTIAPFSTTQVKNEDGQPRHVERLAIKGTALISG